MGRVEVFRTGLVVTVVDTETSLQGGALIQTWAVGDWIDLVEDIKSDVPHPAVDVLPTGAAWLGFQHTGRHQLIGLEPDEWSEFVADVKASKYNIKNLSGPAVGAPGVPAGQVGSDTGVGVDQAATGAGEATRPAPVAAEWVSGLNGAPIDVPAGQLSCAPALDPPQGAGQPGPDLFSADQVEVDYLAEVIAEAHAQGFGGYRLARYILASGYRRDVELLKWDSGPLVHHVDEPVRCGCKMCWSLRETYEASRSDADSEPGGVPTHVGAATGGWKAGPGLHPRGPGPAEPTGGVS